MAKSRAGKALKITFLILLALIILIGGAGFGYYLFIINRPKPQLDGELAATGLKERVEVIRDANGVPHIYAGNLHDLFFAQGYVQAQDRWWQMEFFRKTCGGRIEELTGKRAALVNTDIYLRSLGLYKVAQEEYDSLTAEDRAILDAFARGVNAYISDRSPRQLSVNYTILGLTGVKFQVDPWSPLDSLTFSKLMAWDLGLSGNLELTRVRLYDKLGPEMAEIFLVPPWPLEQRRTIMLEEDLKESFPMGSVARQSEADRGSLLREFLAIAPDISGPAADLSPLKKQAECMGSNSWVAAGNLTKGGTPLLANDPHLDLTQPSIWYEIALHCPNDGTGRPLDVAGFTFAASPGVVVGHNNDIAWGCTNVYPDVNDQYQIKINPDNPLQYQWNDAWRDLTVRDETIRFGDGKPAITIKVRNTHLGPIINDYSYDTKTGALSGFNNKNPLALHWTALEPSTILRSILKLNKAKNWDEFRGALKSWDTPSQSIIYGDRQGNIGYQMPGKIPIRVKNHTGQVPVPGWTSDYEWKGYVPFEMLPHIYNPARHFIVACNQAVALPQYFKMLNDKLGPDVNADFGSKYNRWYYGYRSQRVYDLIQRLAPHTVSTYQSMQGDNKYLQADDVLPWLAKLKFQEPELAEVCDWLLQWDRFAGQDSPQAALYMEFCLKLFQNTFQDQLGDSAVSDGGDREMWTLNLLLERPDDAWWDNAATPDVKETRDDILARSFREGYAATMAALGKDRNAWRWGSLHTATFVSNPLGASGIKLIESLVNQGPVSTSGSNECLNNTNWYASKGNFRVVGLIPSMRIIVDLGDFDQSVSMNSTGASGHPGSRWYGDQIGPWAKVQYHALPWTRSKVEAAAKHRLYLNPSL